MRYFFITTNVIKAGYFRSEWSTGPMGIDAISCQWQLFLKASLHTRVLRQTETSTTTRSPQRDTLWIGMSVKTVFWGWGQLLEETPAARPLRLIDKRHVNFDVFDRSCWSFRTLSEVGQNPYSHKVRVLCQSSHIDNYSWRWILLRSLKNK